MPLPAQGIFVTGGSGYIGRPLISLLLEQGARVRALARAGSEGRIPAGAEIVLGDALDGASFAGAIPAGATVIHLVGTPHPNPAKAAEFRRVDLGSARAMARAASAAGAGHIIYLSVAQPAPVMRAYVEARREAEALILQTGIPATFIRPWYVLGPGHRWPYALIPFYALLEAFPPTREGARRLGFVTLAQMVGALAETAAARPERARNVIDVPAIRRAASAPLL